METIEKLYVEWSNKNFSTNFFVGDSHEITGGRDCFGRVEFIHTYGEDEEGGCYVIPVERMAFFLFSREEIEDFRPALAGFWRGPEWNVPYDLGHEALLAFEALQERLSEEYRAARAAQVTHENAAKAARKVWPRPPRPKKEAMGE